MIFIIMGIKSPLLDCNGLRNYKRGTKNYKSLILTSLNLKIITMTKITDEYMQEMMTRTKEYTIVLLKPGPKTDQENIRNIIWEHGRRNFAMRADGLLSIVAPVTIEGGLNGLYIFNTTSENIPKIMDEDPAIMAGIFLYDVYPCRSFPGDSLGN
jgi:hypothetical protein